MRTDAVTLEDPPLPDDQPRDPEMPRREFSADVPDVADVLARLVHHFSIQQL
jgi:hypothetical protein